MGCSEDLSTAAPGAPFEPPCATDRSWPESCWHRHSTRAARSTFSEGLRHRRRCRISSASAASPAERSVGPRRRPGAPGRSALPWRAWATQAAPGGAGHSASPARRRLHRCGTSSRPSRPASRLRCPQRPQAWLRRAAEGQVASAVPQEEAVPSKDTSTMSLLVDGGRRRRRDHPRIHSRTCQCRSRAPCSRRPEAGVRCLEMPLGLEARSASLVRWIEHCQMASPCSGG
mmetsp:Transcript_2838/g.7647  ORF Transcript_2838/g.7647 Transcript_2838/m.7647 type:complete len:230 (+) Transcript_2838:168-857(+)